MSRPSFIEMTVRGFARALSKALLSEQTTALPGLLQKFDPRVRVIGIFALILSVVLCRKLAVVAIIFLLATILALASRVSLASLAKRVWIVVLAFTGVIALPALFVTPGEIIFRVPALPLSVSAQGLRTAALLLVRVETAVTLTTALVLCTPWTHILKALRSLHVPAEVITMLAMTHRYVFLWIETTNQMFESRQSRTVGTLTGAQRRAMTARTAGVLLSKSIELSHEVYLAMVSRGFLGEVRLLEDFRWRTRDYVMFAAFILTAGTAVWIGR
jgi:cobalt ECF transporter T component CbiQ